MQKTTMIGFDDYSETVTLQLEHGTVCIGHDGTCFISGEHTGKHVNLFDDMSHSDNGVGLSGLMSSGILSQATSFDKKSEVASYLYLLFEAQKSGHDVHIEIRDALQQYKEEAGI